MTMERFTRCSHCQDRYIYLVSGERGYNTNHADSRYCPLCLAVVRQALQSVPRKYEHAWVETTEVTLDQVLAWEREAQAERQAEGKPVLQRVTSPLFDLTGRRRERSGIVRGRGDFGQRTFEFRYWVTQEDDTPTDVVIREEVERELATGATYPWLGGS